MSNCRHSFASFFHFLLTINLAGVSVGEMKETTCKCKNDKDTTPNTTTW